MEQKKKIKIAIIVLAVLLGLSLIALGVTLARNKSAGNAPATVLVPDNLITPDEDDNTGTGDGVGSATSGSQEQTSGGSSSATSPQPSQNTPAASKQAVTIALYNRQADENTPFQVGNMFPGDAETKYFRVQVSYHDQVTVHFRATVRPGYEKLAEVMNVRVRLLTTGEIMYDGLMKTMPASVTHKLASQNTTTDTLYYEITAYLDTSVGNEYQNRDLIADLNWWVEETGNLTPVPTGDTSVTVLWGLLAACSGGILVFLLAARKRREENENG